MQTRPLNLYMYQCEILLVTINLVSTVNDVGRMDTSQPPLPNKTPAI